jgi:hypothetical protein
MKHKDRKKYTNRKRQIQYERRNEKREKNTNCETQRYALSCNKLFPGSL